MPQENPSALEFLLSRRSRPAKTLALPVPTEEELRPILTAAARTPDHGKLEPWRFIVLQGAALARLANLTEERGKALGIEEAKVIKTRAQFADAGLVVAVVSAPVVSEKVPHIEQVYSAGAVCLAMLNAALAAGWGANWLTGWMAFDEEFLTQGLGLTEDENIAGFIHIGTETSAPPERPRPDLDSLTTWVNT
ncbi:MULTISPECIES: nitroreductase [Halocynthiibacter]|uniref:Putative NAD(P)H nitroreductase n=1 Tax=Halocynthiibacter halioticoli TaxID=2986804 RepID=A0AAE3IXC6_9RHOB|nr:MULTISPECIES: nitroreductase [Halocynthiibacter]MCV6823734.1 nitroreductase [Halocynthiibacter halioticoli]MCW4056735.1 nitroreductase [Halocynthiibacter sp. SDUM655004]MDE0590247.1 nitroreductase [Halocynthiibacter sp. C4]